MSNQEDNNILTKFWVWIEKLNCVPTLFSSSFTSFASQKNTNWRVEKLIFINYRSAIIEGKREEERRRKRKGRERKGKEEEEEKEDRNEWYC